MKTTSHFTEANRQAWNAAMPWHRKAKDEYWDSCFADPTWIAPTEPELSALLALHVKDKNIAQLCCNNGLELLSLKRMGAATCVGFDISDEAILDASRRADKYSIEAEFIRTDVYTIDKVYTSVFDIVYITIGAMAWLPDLNAFFRVAAMLLKPGGKLFIYEQHPLVNILPFDVSGNTSKPEITESYFHEGYLEYMDGLDYYGGVEYDSPVKYEFIHTLGDILTAILASGFTLTRFTEYDHDISNGFGWVQQTGLRLPLCYILTAIKN